MEIQLPIATVLAMLARSPTLADKRTDATEPKRIEDRKLKELDKSVSDPTVILSPTRAAARKETELPTLDKALTDREEPIRPKPVTEMFKPTR